MNSSGGTLRLRKTPKSPGVAVLVRRKHGIPASPFIPWKLHKKHFACASNSSPVNFQQGFKKSELSARKLAAGLWQLRFMEVSGDGVASLGYGSVQSSKSEASNGNIRIVFPDDYNAGNKFGKTKNQIWKPLTILRSRNGIQLEFESSTPCLKCSNEEATKWDTGLSKTSNVFTQKLLENEKLIGGSIVSTLLSEFLQAQGCINKLKSARKSSRKKVEQFLRKVEEESMLWKLRERQKIQAVLDDLNDKLARERRSRERMEILNSKLAQELVEANLYTKQIMKNYEEEKRRREIMEEVCNELAKQIGEDKAKLEELERESMKIREELEEERTMLQMAELWREERVQMKLLDAKISFEDKYTQMIQLIAYLQNFLRSRGAQFDIMDLKESELIKQAAKSVRIMDLSCDFSKSGDIFSIYEQLRKQESNERVIKPCLLPCSPAAPTPSIHIQSQYEHGFNNNNVGLHQLSSSSEYDMGFEANNTGENVTLVEDRDCTSPYLRRDTLINSVNRDNNILNAVECSGNADMDSPRTGVTDVSSVSARQCDQTASTVPITCQRKRPAEGVYRNQEQQNSPDLLLDECKKSLSTSTILGIDSQCKGEGESGFRRWEPVGQGNSTDAMNPHVTRGMRGSIEWPRGIPKTKLKAIPLEARVRTQKSQLQQILKPKA
ncbi:hypothetical protein L6164_035886 [Bauhinia variegata]|uniref:Uncharacterized protein n=1 Tax=Bauhinia variegata TaxID=167791 RepID=A0ACB9KFC6_BAUVA|nr:hypothetical protein L6164_035886 [Bauhinia variegata]